MWTLLIQVAGDNTFLWDAAFDGPTSTFLVTPQTSPTHEQIPGVMNWQPQYPQQGPVDQAKMLED
uniref:Putative alpha-mannosidase I MNS5 n=1 Tax=Rhizophora mucronata TaxID=61149 RepID=A0A2P2LST6_RHIMU